MPPTYCHQSSSSTSLAFARDWFQHFPLGKLPELYLNCFNVFLRCLFWSFNWYESVYSSHWMASFFLNKVNAIKIRSSMNRISFLNSISCQQAHNHCSGCQGLQEGRMPGPWPPSLDIALMQEASRRVQKSWCAVPPVNPSTWQKASASLSRQLYGRSEFQEKF